MASANGTSLDPLAIKCHPTTDAMCDCCPISQYILPHNGFLSVVSPTHWSVSFNGYLWSYEYYPLFYRPLSTVLPLANTFSSLILSVPLAALRYGISFDGPLEWMDLRFLREWLYIGFSISLNGKNTHSGFTIRFMRLPTRFTRLPIRVQDSIYANTYPDSDLS